MRILHAHYVLHGALRPIVSVFIITREAKPDYLPSSQFRRKTTNMKNKNETAKQNIETANRILAFTQEGTNRPTIIAKIRGKYIAYYAVSNPHQPALIGELPKVAPWVGANEEQCVRYAICHTRGAVDWKYLPIFTLY